VTDTHVQLLRRIARQARRRLLAHEQQALEDQAPEGGSSAGLERAVTLADERLAAAEARRRRPPASPLVIDGQET
jgi:anti-sigma factor ChrR (cupin superfamily)